MSKRVAELDVKVIKAREAYSKYPTPAMALAVIHRQEELIAALKEEVRKERRQGPFATEVNDGGYAAD